MKSITRFMSILLINVICYSSIQTSLIYLSNLDRVLFCYLVVSLLCSESKDHRRLIIAMDRAQLILLGLPIFLFCSDLFNLFTPPPPKPPPNRPHQPPPHVPRQQRPAGFTPETLDFPSQV